MAQYMNCGTEDERSDFFAFNDYSWCAPSSFTTSGWDKKVENFTDYGLPLFLSEYGCITNERDWGEVEALYSDKMTGVYSGGLVYEYSKEKNGYGIVDVSGNDAEPLKDFDTLQKAFKDTPNPKGDGGYKKDVSPAECPKPNPPNWDVESTLLPAIPKPALKFMKDGAGDGPGLNSGGSQNAGTPSTETAKPGSGSSTGSSDSDNAAPGLRPAGASFVPLIVAAVVTMSSMFGASLIIV